MQQRKTTNYLIARLGLQRRLGREAVDWAVDQLSQGKDTPHLRQLAGMTGIENDFELDEMLYRALSELGVVIPDHDSAIIILAQELAHDYLAGGIDRQNLLKQLCDLCIETGYHDDLYPFYLLRWTDADLKGYGEAHYWKDATPENFEELLREEIRTLLAIQRS